MLDPFRPEKPEDVERLHRLQAEIHDGFKDWVRERRAGKLSGRRGNPVQRRVLDRQARAGAGSGRRTGRVARHPAGALRRQGASAGDRAAAPPAVALRARHIGWRNGRRRHRPGDVGSHRRAPALATFWTIGTDCDETAQPRASRRHGRHSNLVRDAVQALPRRRLRRRAADLRRGHDRLRHLHRLHDRPRSRRAEAVAQRLGHHPQLPLRPRQDRGHRLGRPADRGRHGRVAVRRLPSQRRPLRPAGPHHGHAGPQEDRRSLHRHPHPHVAVPRHARTELTASSAECLPTLCVGRCRRHMATEGS